MKRTSFIPALLLLCILLQGCTSSRLDRRLSRLDDLAEAAAESDPDKWLDPGAAVPDDCALYRYVDGRLQSWVGQFPTTNDDIESKVEVERLVNPGIKLRSPLCEARQDSYSFIEIGRDAYLVKSLERGRVKIIYGLSLNPAGSRALRILPLCSTEGTTVSVDGKPQFKVAPQPPAPGDRSAAAGPLLEGFLLVALVIMVLSFAVFLLRSRITARLSTHAAKYVCGALAALASVGIVFFVDRAFHFIILYSNVSLELYKISNLSPLTGVVYLCAILLLSAIPMLLTLTAPAFTQLTGRTPDFLSLRGRFTAAAAIALYLVVTGAISGRSREEHTASVWASRLSTQTSLPVEMRLSRSGFNIPPRYSYAKYQGDDCLFFKGQYAYPTRLPQHSRFHNPGIHKQDGYEHYVSRYPDGVTVVISRPVVAGYLYFIDFLFLFLLPFGLLFLWRTGRREKIPYNFFRRRISMVLVASLFLTLAGLAAVSVVFVYGRNEASQRSIVSERISTAQSLVQKSIRGARTSRDVRTPAVLDQLRGYASTLHSPISVFGTDGLLLMTTAPELYERRLAGGRVNGRAYESIIVEGNGSYVEKERMGPHRHLVMYAPLFGAAGDVIAIISTPYIAGNYDFEHDAILHTVSVVTVFAILLMAAWLLTTAIISRMFAPLTEMSRKMSSGDAGAMEHIRYEGNDELRPLVDSYNLMVDELSRRTAALAQAERDKAWSAMARQVAHEIKNPLTPMRLQLQRVMRLRANGNPKWEELFDEASSTILEHIDILTETADEFSTFAKLYTEEPADFDVDAVLSDEVSMYDSRAGIRFEYIGMPGTVISGPRPQLIRVFVNLLNNASQACGGVPDGGQVLVSLRNGSNGAFYEIVVEDNGPGVSPDNVERLFTPNFTTKNGGSGLGLAMCRSILDRCGALISYSKSFQLGGACFTILYPRK